MENQQSPPLHLQSPPLVANHNHVKMPTSTNPSGQDTRTLNVTLDAKIAHEAQIALEAFRKGSRNHDYVATLLERRGQALSDEVVLVILRSINDSGVIREQRSRS